MINTFSCVSFDYISTMSGCLLNSFFVFAVILSVFFVFCFVLKLIPTWNNDWVSIENPSAPGCCNKAVADGSSLASRALNCIPSRVVSTVSGAPGSFKTQSMFTISDQEKKN